MDTVVITSASSDTNPDTDTNPSKFTIFRAYDPETDPEDVKLAEPSTSTPAERSRSPCISVMSIEPGTCKSTDFDRDPDPPSASKPPVRNHGDGSPFSSEEKVAVGNVESRDRDRDEGKSGERERRTSTRIDADADGDGVDVE